MATTPVKNNPLILSYAQNAEDIILNRVFRNIESGFYIDIGAYHPTEDSVTKLFYNKGWTGINIEPIPTQYRLFVDNRKRDTNLNVGVSDTTSICHFYECTSCQGWSTFSKELADRLKQEGAEFKQHQIPVIQLDKLFRDVVKSKTVHFLKIDAEGYEDKIILNTNWRKHRPIVIVVEKNNLESWEPTLLGNGYQFALDDGINRFYLRAEDKQLSIRLTEPANIKDVYIKYAIFAQLEEDRKNIEIMNRELADKNRYIEELLREIEKKRGIQRFLNAFRRLLKGLPGRS